jgi:cytochrome c
MIWYPYAPSKEFPELGQGGRSAMAGSFYSFDEDSDSKNKFPEYYNGALFVFDWMRNWVMALRFDENENYLRSEPFMSANGDFRRPIDLTFGKDGNMYMLEYGSVYGADNTDSRLVRIEYNSGNRAPVAKASVVDSAAEASLDKRVFLTSERRPSTIHREAVGESPLRVKFSSSGTVDPDDDDQITYEWLFDGKSVESTDRNPTYTFPKPGIYQTILRVKDQKRATGSDTVLVKVGNATPDIAIITDNNKFFYWDKERFNYQVKVTDKEDGIPSAKDIKVELSYNPEPVTQMIGASLIAGSDCKACHTIEDVSVGPSYLLISKRYKGKPDALSKLTQKIITGGGGNWGTEHVMSAHPQLPEHEVNEMVKYILSLSDVKREKTVLPLKGTLVLNQHNENEPMGVYTLTATYTDRGANGIPPLTKTNSFSLRKAKVQTIHADAHIGFRRFGDYITGGDHKSYVLLKNVDLTGISGFTYEYTADDKNGEIEVRIDSQAGPVIATSPCKATGGKIGSVASAIKNSVTGNHDVYFFVIKRDKPNNDVLTIKTITFNQ